MKGWGGSGGDSPSSCSPCGYSESRPTLRRYADLDERRRPAADLTRSAFAGVVVRGDVQHVVSRLLEGRVGGRLPAERLIQRAAREDLGGRLVLVERNGRGA